MSLRRNPLPPETPEVRRGLVEAWKALKVLDEADLLDFIAEKAFDPKAADQARDAIASLEASMSPNLLVTILPSGTKVRFATGEADEDRAVTGEIRDGAYGLFPDQPNSTERRITANGWEHMISPETTFNFFEVLERPDWKAFRPEGVR